MSEYRQIAVRQEELDDVGTVVVAKALRARFLDELHIRDFGDELLRVLATKPNAMVVNFEAVEFLSSSTIGQLVKVRKQARSADVRLVLTELDETVMEVFRMTHLDKQMEINTTEKRALASLAFPIAEK